METTLTPKTPEVVNKGKQPGKNYHVVVFCETDYVSPAVFDHVLGAHLGFTKTQITSIGIAVWFLGSAVVCTTTKDIAETMVETANNCPLVKQTEFLKFVVKCQH